MGRDYKQKKELEELRRIGAIPAEVDKDGNMINPHMPAYMSKQPWYLDSGQAGLQHHRMLPGQKKVGPSFHDAQKTGVKRGGKVLKRWKKGCCANCGAPTHKTKDCVERRRRRPAKISSRDMMPEEHVVKDMGDTWDTKRDRYKGFDMGQHMKDSAKRYQKLDAVRKKKRAEEFEKKIREGDEKTQRKFKKKLRKLKGAAAGVSSDSSDSDSDDDGSSDDGLKDEGEQIQISTERQTVRNLRLREDLPKYLMNLDSDSAFYDPKSRSMRENPYANNPELDAKSTYHGDNFMRYDGEAQQYFAQMRFAGVTRDTIGEDAAGCVHQATNPTGAEMVFKKQYIKRGDLKETFDEKLLSKYGGEEHLKKPEFRTQADEVYREFAPDGRVTKGPKLVAARSKYVEDEHPGNHTSVWGSWYDVTTHTWGFVCCKETVRRSYCTGVGQKTVAVVTQNSVIGKKRKNIPGPAKAPASHWTQNERTAGGYTKVKGLLAGLSQHVKRQKFDISTNFEDGGKINDEKL